MLSQAGCFGDPGPSPRVRGIPGERLSDPGRRGSIPAGAGNPVSSASGSRREWVHPRGCGESRPSPEGGRTNRGPSPRVRGILVRAVRGAERPGSIPAGAGNPRLALGRADGERVHPRGCGESRGGRRARPIQWGPSPRVRGIPHPRRRGQRHQGSIPAGAGNPGSVRPPAAPTAVHPRGCGESIGCPLSCWRVRGPSPRVRGIHVPPVGVHRRGGSIPAGAGNPRGATAARDGRRVHPRGCGESAAGVHADCHERGPSPRVRGIRPGLLG